MPNLIWKTKPVSEEDSERQLAEYFKALAHPVRIRIFRTLLTRPSRVCGDLVDMFPLAQSTVSQHLKILKDAGLIEDTEEGPRRSYCVNPKSLNRLKRRVAAI